MIDKNQLAFTQKEIEDLGYEVSYVCTNKNKPDQIQQMHVYKDEKVIARVSLMLACRMDMMKNGVGRNEKELFMLLGKLSINI